MKFGCCFVFVIKTYGKHDSKQKWFDWQKDEIISIKWNEMKIYKNGKKESKSNETATCDSHLTKNKWINVYDLFC